MTISYVNYENINSIFQKSLNADKEYLYRVGYCFLNGDGVDKNLPLAYLFLKISCETGNELASEKIKYIQRESLCDHSIYEAVDILNNMLSFCKLENNKNNTTAIYLKEKLINLLS